MSSVTISIDVPDLARAERFYCDALGCVKQREEGSMVVLSLGSTEIYLLERSEGSNPVRDSAISRSYRRHWTPVHIDFLLDDIDGAAERIQTLGGSVEGRDSGDWGAIAYCVDPFGHGFCIIRE